MKSKRCKHASWQEVIRLTTIKWFVGVRKATMADKFIHCVIFSTNSEVLESNYGDRFTYCYGGYTTKQQAIRTANYHNYIIDEGKEEPSHGK
jgi:hypothetical protein